LLRDHDLVDQRDVRLRVEHVHGQLGGTGLLALGVQHVDGDRRLLSLLRHAVHAPFTAVLTTTVPPLGPGTAPLMSSRPCSASTAWTRRFWVVWRTLPIRPAIFRPLKTRAGVAAPPIAPGLRWLRCAPWEAPAPAKPCRFITPAVPLPLVVPTTSTNWPAEKMSTDSSWPGSYSAASSVRTSATWRRGVTSALAKWPL